MEESYVTSADRGSIVSYYDQALRARGWQTRGHVERGEIATDCYQKDDYGAAVKTRLTGPSGSWTLAFRVARDSDACLP